MVYRVLRQCDEIFSFILTVGDSLLLLRIYLYIASPFAETFPENPDGLMLLLSELIHCYLLEQFQETVRYLSMNNMGL